MELADGLAATGNLARQVSVGEATGGGRETELDAFFAISGRSDDFAESVAQHAHDLNNWAPKASLRGIAAARLLERDQLASITAALRIHIRGYWTPDSVAHSQNHWMVHV